MFQMFRYDAALGWAGRPHAKIMHLEERLNSHGLRGPEFPDEKPAGVVRIVALGDSCTFNVQFYDLNREIPLIVLENPYPALLGRMLEPYDEPGRAYQVFNGGTIGYSTLQGLRFMQQKALRWNPDVFLIRYGWNDHWHRTPDYTLRPEPRSPQLRWVYARLRESYLYRFIMRLTATLTGGVQTASPPGDRPPDAPPITTDELRVPPEEFDFNLRLIIREARQHGAVPILINAPEGVPHEEFLKSTHLSRLLEFVGYDSLEEVFEVHKEYREIVERVAREEKVPLVDLEAAFAARGRAGLFGPTEVLHPNQEGNELTAKLVLRKLQELDIVGDRRAERGRGLEIAPGAADGGLN